MTKGPSRPGPLGSTGQENTRHDERARSLEILRSGGPSQEAKKQHPPAHRSAVGPGKGRGGRGDRGQEPGGPHAAGEGSSHAPAPTLSRSCRPGPMSCLVSSSSVSAKGRAIFESDRSGRRCRGRGAGPHNLTGRGATCMFTESRSRQSSPARRLDGSRSTSSPRGDGVPTSERTR
jgi:hypothetical protein